MKKHYYLIGWGLTLTFLNGFSHIGVGTLIDIVAYSMVFVGVSRMQSINPAFKWAKILSLLLVLLTAVNAFIPEGPAVPNVALLDFPFGVSLMTLVFSLAMFALVYALCEGTKIEAEKVGENELASKMRTGFWLYFIPSVSAIGILLLLVLLGEGSAGVLFLLLMLPGLLSIVGIISIILGLRRAGRDLHSEAYYENYEGEGPL